MERLLTFDGAVPRDPEVERWFERRSDAYGALARQWFHVIRDCGPDVLELVHDGCPVACVQEAPFAYVNAFRAHVNVGFFYGARLPDPQGLLQGAGKNGRHVKLRPGEVVLTAALTALVQAAYRDIRHRLRLPE